MRYVAEEWGSEWRVRIGEYPNLRFINNVTEVEAKAFAFALNGLVDGETLEYACETCIGGCGMQTEYDGPVLT